MKHNYFLFLLLWSLSCLCTPRVSIITSVYDGDQFIEGFLHDIVAQTIFDECELILINANSPGNEGPTIKRFMQKYSNIVYIKLDKDPGIYGVWNLGVKRAQAPFVTNANLDDRRNPHCLAIHAQVLAAHPEIDLVYSNYCFSFVPNEPFAANSKTRCVTPAEFSLKSMMYCLPGPQPLWRKSMHNKYGYFNENFLYAGDMEMWLRAVSQGAQFKKVNILSGSYYYNPKGLSTSPEPTRAARRYQENQWLVKNYSYVWS